MRRVRFTIGVDEFEAEMPQPLYDIVLGIGVSGASVDTLPPDARTAIADWATRNAIPTNHVGWVSPELARDAPELVRRGEAQARGDTDRPSVEWVELGGGMFTNANPITYTAQYPPYEYEYDFEDLNTGSNALDLSADLTPDEMQRVYGMLSGGGPAPDPDGPVMISGPYAGPDEMIAAWHAYEDGQPRTPAATDPVILDGGPAAPHLSNDTSRSAYAAAGALRDAGDARDDDLKWPDEWNWGKPAPMLGKTHEAVYADGTLPVVSDEEFPETFSEPLPDEIDGVPVVRPAGLFDCTCSACALRAQVIGRMRGPAAALIALRAPAEDMNSALQAVRARWDAMVDYAAAVDAATTRAVEGANSGTPTGIITGLSGASLGIVDASPDRPRGFLDGLWVEPAYGDPDDHVWAPASGGRSSFAGDWSERIRTAPQPLTWTADPRDCAPRVVDTLDEIRFVEGVAVVLAGPDDLRQRIRNGDVIELGRNHMRVIRETVTAPRSIRPQRVVR